MSRLVSRPVSSLVLRLLLVCASGLGQQAIAQPVWQWRDANGGMVYSDRPPPPYVPQHQILRQPGPAGTPSSEASGDLGMPQPKTSPKTAAPRTPAAPTASPGLSTGVASTAPTSPSGPDEARLAAIRADNCLRARQSLAALRVGQRMSRYTEQGERLYLDEAEISAETQRLEGIVQQDCR